MKPTITRDEAYQEYDEALNKASREFEEAKAAAKAVLHEELKALRNLSQRGK